MPQCGVDLLVSMPSDASLLLSARDSHEVEAGVDEEEGDLEWDWAKLLPDGLFSADLGLTVKFTSLSKESVPGAETDAYHGRCVCTQCDQVVDAWHDGWLDQGVADCTNSSVLKLRCTAPYKLILI